MSASPTLSGAELGKCNPRREVPGGIWIEEGGALVNRPAWLRIVRERDGNASLDYARQLLTARGDGTFIPGQLSRWAMFFQLHFALIEPPQEGKPQALMFPIPPGLADEKGKLSIPAVWQLPLNDLADGQLDRIFEYGVSDAPDSAAQGQRGQGLFVARTYMAKMGGTIAAANVDGGVCFSLRLPLAVGA